MEPGLAQVDVPKHEENAANYGDDVHLPVLCGGFLHTEGAMVNLGVFQANEAGPVVEVRDPSRRPS